MIDKSISALAAAVVSVSSTYKDRPEAVLYGIALGMALAESHKSVALYRVAVSILASEDGDGSAISIEDADSALHQTAYALLAHL